MVKKAIKLLVVTELVVILTNFISFEFFINFQIAYFSSLFVILGSTYAYRKMVNAKVSHGDIDEQRELYDTIEDPYEIYDDKEINNAPVEELDLKTIVKEEKQKIKVFNFSEIKKGSRASFSLFRLVPYVFLILGFIALKNNEVLNIAIYLPSLLVGIVVGYAGSKSLYS